MNGPSWGERISVWSARILACLYPRAFRDAHREMFAEAAAHRWHRERRWMGVSRATICTLWLLAIDTASAAPRAWSARRRRTGQNAGSGSRGLGQWFGDTGRDARYALRTLRRRPAFALLVTTTLGLGIGVSVSLFGALDRIVLRPLPYEGGDRMVYLAMRHQQRGWQMSPSQSVVDRWREAAQTLEWIEIYRQQSVTRTGGGPPSVASVTAVSANLPGRLGVRPVLGRMLGPTDAVASAPPAVMLGERYWRSAFGADGQIAGRTLTLNDTVFTVAGVWPESARLNYSGASDLFRVLPLDREMVRGDFALVLGLVVPGASAADIEGELASLAAGDPDHDPEVVPAVNPPYGFLGQTYVQGLWLVFGAGLVLMIVAVVNAANLMLGETLGRRREIGVRLALGGSVRRLARLFLSESILLTGAGLGLALWTAGLVGAAVAAVEPGRLVPPGTMQLGSRLVQFAGLLTMVTAALCALLPLVQARAEAIRNLVTGANDLRAAGATTSRIRFGLVGVQAALAVLLATGATLTGRSFVQLSRVDPGVDAARLVVFSLRQPSARPEETRRAFFAEVRDALTNLPGVVSVTTSSAPLFRASVRGSIPYLVGEPPPETAGGEFVSTHSAAPGYFRTLGIPILAGRGFAATGEPNRAVIVNEAFARRYDGDVVGRSLIFPNDTITTTIVGVVGNVRSAGLDDTGERIQLYYPSSPSATYQRYVLRTSGAPATVLSAARARVAQIDADVPLLAPRTGADFVREETAEIRFVAFLLGSFAVVGIFFAVAGIYSALALDVTRRTRELGIRIAMGASGRRVVLETIARGLRPIAVGALVGVAVAAWVSPALESLLYQVPPRDPLSAGVGLALLGVTAIVGCWRPALRIAMVDPSEALRAE